MSTRWRGANFSLSSSIVAYHPEFQCQKEPVEIFAEENLSSGIFPNVTPPMMSGLLISNSPWLTDSSTWGERREEIVRD